MPSLYTAAPALAQWPTAERLRALKRIVPRARVQDVLRRTGHAHRRYLRLPAWFMVWFVIALAYLAFVSLALPPSMLGVIWPSMRLSFGQPLSAERREFLHAALVRVLPFRET